MSERHDYGPLQTFEVTWKSGHIETVRGHQVLFESSGSQMATVLLGVSADTPKQTEPRFMIHGEFDGHWRLVLAAPESELRSVRNVTECEVISERGGTS